MRICSVFDQYEKYWRFHVSGPALPLNSLWYIDTLLYIHISSSFLETMFDCTFRTQHIRLFYLSVCPVSLTSEFLCLMAPRHQGIPTRLLTDENAALCLISLISGVIIGCRLRQPTADHQPCFPSRKPILVNMSDIISFVLTRHYQIFQLTRS